MQVRVRERLFALAISIIAPCVMASASAQTSLIPHTATYKVSAGIAGGRLQTQLVATADGFRATHSVRPTGLARLATRGTIIESSDFTLDGTRLRMRQYDSEDSISKERGTIALIFDWDDAQLTGEINLDDTPARSISQSLDPLLQDRVAIQYQLMLDLANDGERETYQLFDIDGNKTLNITRIGEESVKVGRQRYTAIGIQHQSEGSSRYTQLWCVPELGFLPAKIEQYRKDKLKVRISLLEYAPLSTD
ncbi:MAG: DUF3108 domain-containing protein [Pseudomonadota bacterium]